MSITSGRRKIAPWHDGAPIPSTKWTVAVGLAFRRCFLEGSLRCRSLILALLTAPTIIVRCNAKIKRKSEDFSPGRASCASPNDLLDIHQFGIGQARAEQGSLGRGAVGIVSSMGDQRLEVSAIGVHQWIRHFFELFGVTVEHSEPGRRRSRLIRQLGGIQGCRVLKVRGARELIRKYGPDRSFAITSGSSQRSPLRAGIGCSRIPRAHGYTRPAIEQGQAILGQRSVYIPQSVRELFAMRKRIGMAAGLILLALMASLVLSRTRNGPAALSSLRFNEIQPNPMALFGIATVGLTAIMVVRHRKHHRTRGR